MQAAQGCQRAGCRWMSVEQDNPAGGGVHHTSPFVHEASVVHELLAQVSSAPWTTRLHHIPSPSAVSSTHFYFASEFLYSSVFTLSFSFSTAVGMLSGLLWICHAKSLLWDVCDANEAGFRAYSSHLSHFRYQERKSVENIQ